MNLKVGLLRLWIVASVAWIALLAYGLYDTIKHDPWRVVSVDGSFSLRVLWINFAGNDATVPVLIAAVLGPLLALGAGHAVAWIIRGFRSAKAA